MRETTESGVYILDHEAFERPLALDDQSQEGAGSVIVRERNRGEDGRETDQMLGKAERDS